MSAADFRYDGRRVLVVGGATGMGAAAARTVAELGAEVCVMDVAPIEYPCKQQIRVDLREQASVDAALAQVEGSVDAVFSCAGISDGPGLMLINFISQRHILDGLVADGRLGRGGAVAMISSAAGMGWQTSLEQTRSFLACPDWDAAVAWLESHPGNDHYLFSKQVMCTYVAQASFELLRKGIRLNAVLPGPTDTPLARANADVWLAFGEPFRKQQGVPALTPSQIGDTLIFLCSDAASGITGANLIVDQGHASAVLAGAYDDAGVKGLLGLG